MAGTEIKAALKRLVCSALDELRGSAPNDVLYGVFLAGPPEGDFFYPLLFTRQRLDCVASAYLRKGYRVTRGDPMAVLRALFRWAPGEDWFRPPIEATSEARELLTAAFARGEFERYGGETVDLCLQALRELEQERVFSLTDRPVLGFSYRSEGPEELVRWIRALNPPDVAKAVEAQIAEGFASEKWVRTPYRRS